MKTFKDLEYSTTTLFNGAEAPVDTEIAYTLIKKGTMKVIRVGADTFDVYISTPEGSVCFRECPKEKVDSLLLDFGAYDDPGITRSTEPKNDRLDNKVRWELMPLSLLNEIAKVYTVGSEKYGANTWQDLENGYERYKAAALRHIISYEEGEQADPETGLHPLAHAAWNMIACLYFGLKKKEE